MRGRLSPASLLFGTGAGADTGSGAALQSSHQRLCAALLLKLVRRLLRSQPADLSAQLAR